MSQKYEVLRFAEQGGSCRQGLDCLEGVVLADFMGECPCMDKEELFRLLACLGMELERCRKANGGRGMRLVNPYSILLTGDGLCLLNMDSPENEPLLRKMQGRELRSRFLRPLYEGGVREMSRGDLFGYGKTMQFMLACTRLSPPLTGWERRRMMRIVGRCTGEGGRRYAGPEEAVRDIPKCLGWQDALRSRVVKMSATVVILSAVALVLLGMLLSPILGDGRGHGEAGQGTDGQGTEKQDTDSQNAGVPGRNDRNADNQSIAGWRVDGQDVDGQRADGQGTDGQDISSQDGSDGSAARFGQESALRERMEDVINILSGYGHEDTEEGTALMTRCGKELRLRCSWLMARTYEREGMAEEALDEYALIILQEERRDRILLALKKKLELELSLERYAQAIRTGEDIQERFGAQEEISHAIERCRKLLEDEAAAQQQAQDGEG